MNGSVSLTSKSEEETRSIASRLAAVLQPGDIIGLSGELGAGKTALVRGLAEGLGIPPETVHSPSFALILPYEGGRLPLFHIDLYRFQAQALDRIALREYLYSDGVTAIEWFEHFGEAFPEFLELRLTLVEAEVRGLVATAHGSRYIAHLSALAASTGTAGTGKQTE